MAAFAAEVQDQILLMNVEYKAMGQVYTICVCTYVFTSHLVR